MTQQSCGLLVLEKVWWPWEVSNNWEKKENVIPIFKTSKENLGKYRLVSLISIPGKTCLHVLRYTNKDEESEPACSLRANHEWATWLTSVMSGSLKEGRGVDFVYLKNGTVLRTNTPIDSQSEAKQPKQIVNKVCGRHSWTVGLREPWPMAVSYKWLSSGVSIFRPNPVQYFHHLPCTLTKMTQNWCGWENGWYWYTWKGRLPFIGTLTGVSWSPAKTNKAKSSKVLHC